MNLIAAQLETISENDKDRKEHGCVCVRLNVPIYSVVGVFTFLQYWSLCV